MTAVAVMVCMLLVLVICVGVVGAIVAPNGFPFALAAGVGLLALGALLEPR
jgi:hypothetical protein